MKYARDKGAHGPNALQYHLVKCVRHRKKVLVSEQVVEALRTKVCEARYAPLVAE